MLVYCNHQILADRVSCADTFFTRFKGLMGKNTLSSGEGLLLKHCTSIHCFFMKFSIDAVYLSKDMTVLGVETLMPWSVGSRINKTAHVLELTAGSGRVSFGDVLSIQEIIEIP